MTTEEFSNTFDTIVNSYRDIKGFGHTTSGYSLDLDEYEKSVLLTQAQDIVVKSYFDRTLNQQGQGFDDTERRQIDFSELITVAEPTRVASPEHKFDTRSQVFTMPASILFILNEKLITADTPQKSFVVIPINYKEYDRLMSKAYGAPLKRQAWRLFQNTSQTYDFISEIIPNSYVQTPGTATYTIRYVKRPSPIILTDLTSSNLQIDNIQVVTECQLNPIIHMDILNKAVELAFQTRLGGSAQSNSNQQQQQQQQ